MAVLEVRGLHAPVAGGPALAGLDLEVGEFEILGLAEAGAGGAAALLDCISGHRRVARGRIHHRGVDVTHLPAHRRARLGLGRTFAGAGQRSSGSALDAVMTAQHAQIRYSTVGGMLGSPAAAATERVVAQRARDLLELLGVAHLAGVAVRSLPPDSGARVQLAAVLGTDPDVVLLDAPSRGLDAAQADALGGLLLRVRRDLGITLVVSDARPGLLAVCDHVHVLARGREVAQGPPAEVLAHPAALAVLRGEEGLDGPA